MRRVHPSYLEAPGPGWLVADGGRCYKAQDCEEHFRGYLQCPQCPQWSWKKGWFASLDAYVQHYETVHLPQGV